MALEWNARLAVGHAEIDRQHQELFRRFAKFLESCQQARAREEVEPLLNFLDSYVKAHFHQEEVLMVQHRYPGLSGHRAAHREFMDQLGELRTALENEGASSVLVIHTNQTLLNWILKHIKSADLQFGAFLKHGNAPGEATLRTQALHTSVRE